MHRQMHVLVSGSVGERLSQTNYGKWKSIWKHELDPIKGNEKTSIVDISLLNLRPPLRHQPVSSYA